jgi:hypothetical protein
MDEGKERALDDALVHMKAMLLTHEFVLHALVMSHPDPGALKDWLQRMAAAQHVSRLDTQLRDPQPLPQDALMSEHIDRWLARVPPASS